jgi:type II secretory pathway component GspD/PulD (secretin)
VVPPPVEAAGALETRLDAAEAMLSEGRHSEAAALLRGMLASEASYRVMPELLYLLGRCELDGGARQNAALSFHLLRRYYPRRWSILPDRGELAVVAGEYRPNPLAAADEWDIVATRHLSALGENSPGGSGDYDRFREMRISNMFYETDIQQVLGDISAQAGIPIVAAEGVRGLVTLELDDVPLLESLRRVAAPLGLTYRWLDGYFLVGEADPSSPSSMPLVETIEVRPRHVLAEDVPGLLPLSYNRFLRVAPGGGNTVIVTGPPEILERFVDDLREIDRPRQQVMIEALVFETSRDVAREWGIDWEVLGTHGSASFRFAKLVPAMLDSSVIASGFDTGVDIFGAVADVGTAVRAMEGRGEASVKANPRVATLDGREARIRVGSEAYYSLLSGSVTYPYYTLQKIATGVTLTITPHIGATAEITSDIAVEVSDVRSSGTDDLPVTSVKEVQTRARVDNGESVIIGGLLSESAREKTDRVPILGRIPILGALFGHSSMEEQQNEVFVVVTPHVMIHPSEYVALLEETEPPSE